MYATKPAAGKQNKKVGCCLYATTPNNQEEEKRKFFESNFEYDPQFTYTNENMATKYLS